MAQILPLFTYYPVYNNTVHGVFLHGWQGNEGCPLFVTPSSSPSLPGSPPGATLEIGRVSIHVDGTVAREFTIRGAPTDHQSAPWGVATVYSVEQ